MNRRTVAAPVLLAGVLVAGCGGGDEAARVCATDAGTTACLVDGSGGRSVKLEAEGFRPDSEIGVAGLDPDGDQIGKVGRIGGNGKLEDDMGYEGPSGGQVPEIVVTVQGTSRSGTPVLLTVRRPAG